MDGYRSAIALAFVSMVLAACVIVPPEPRSRTRGDDSDWGPGRPRTTSLSGAYTIRHLDTGQYVDAYESAKRDFGLITRPAMDDDSQVWILERIGGAAYTIQQASSQRYMDAHEKADEDFRVVTRTAQHNRTQLWIVRHVRNNIYTIQQVSSGRFVEAYRIKTRDFRLVTRQARRGEAQKWAFHAY